MCQFDKDRHAQNIRFDVQESVYNTNRYYNSAHPNMYRRKLGWLLRFLVQSMVHEAQNKLAKHKQEQQYAYHLVRIAELFGLLLSVRCSKYCFGITYSVVKRANMHSQSKTDDDTNHSQALVDSMPSDPIAKSQNQDAERK